MDRAGDEFFAGSGFAFDENGAIQGGVSFHFFKSSEEVNGLAEDTGEVGV